MAVISIPSSIAGVSLPGSLSQLAKGPLSALYQGTGVPTLNYPSDLATDPTKSHYVTFSVKEIVPADYTNTTGVVAGQKAQVLPPSVVEAAGSAVGVPDSVTQPVAAGISISPKRFESRGVISLYMPDTLTAQYNGDYSDFNLTDVGGSTIRSIGQIADKAMSGDFSSAKSSFNSVLNMLSTDPATTALATKAFSGLAGKAGVNADALSTVLLKAEGYSINPQLQLIYTGVGLRTFSLSFVFTPKSKDEAQTVAKIIKMFKYHFSPGLQKGKDTSSNSMFLEAPSVFGIQFKINGIENDYLPKYGDCVLENIDVNYAPNGWAAFEDGAPVQTTLNLQFKETEIVDKARILNETLR